MASLLHLITLLSVAALASATCPDGWSENGGRCFLFVNQKKTMADSEVDCHSRGAHIATYGSPADVKFVRKTMGVDVPTWTGVSDALQEGSYRSNDCSTANAAWVSGKLSGADPDADCVELRKDGSFNNRSCDRMIRYVCARSAE